MEEQSNEELNRGEKKNQKNIYVHKIKSLMRISKDSLHQDQKEINIALNKKHIKKVRSEVDKTAIKLEKNRESAKRARLRKKLYIKLLELRVQKLRTAADEGLRIQNEFARFAQMVSKKERNINNRNERQFSQVENYLDQEPPSHKTGEERKSGFAKMDKLIEQICQVSMCSSLRNIRELSSQISLDEIIKANLEQERQQQGEELQDIIKEVLVQAQKLRSIYQQIMNKNDLVKRAVQFRSEHQKQPAHQDIDPQEFCSFGSKKNGNQSIFINLTEGEKILIEGWSYLEQKLNDQCDL